ncbi:MAG TPA: YciI family protein [Pyrinomonadaceae bacterium]|nr:YciI family protein [Pyrinomonadaceae bacterium]
MRTRIAIKLLLLYLFAASLSFAQPKDEPQNKLVQFQMALIRKGPKWTDKKSIEIKKLHEKHFNYVLSLLDSGKAVIAGPTTEGGDLLGVFILRARSTEEARAWIENDPEVKAGRLKSEIHPWWSEDIFKKANSPLKMTTVYLGFLKRGPNRKPGDGNTPEVQELQKAHMANINRLAETRKLVMAGPFGDDGDLRGIFVFRTESLKEAEELTATDPMIKIDRLRLELHPWQVPAGVIP